MGSYGSDIGRAHAIHMSWEGGKVAGRAECNTEWIAWAESQCPHGGIDSGGMICLECYQCWIKRKKEVSNGK